LFGQLDESFAVRPVIGDPAGDVVDWRHLLELGDRLRDLDDPAYMALAAAEIIGRALGASRAGYATVDLPQETVEVGGVWSASGVASIDGTYQLRSYADYIEVLKRGEPLVSSDISRHKRVAATADLWRAAGAIAQINYPIFEHGTFAAVFFVHHGAPREWSAGEVAFVRNVADRAWSAMQRCRAEIRLRELAASLERQVAERTADRNRLWQISTDIMLVVRFDGIVTSINPAWTTVLGWQPYEVLGGTLIPFIHPDDVERTVAAATSLEQGATLHRFDNRYRHKQGGYRWITWAAVPGGGAINALGRDTTEERERAAALELAEARLRSVFETTYQLQGLTTTDGIVLDANPIALAAIEARLEDVIGLPFWATPWFTGTPGMPEQVQAAIPLVAAGETFRQEVVVNLPTGRRAFDFAMRPVRNAAGEVIAIVPEAMELTERRAAEEQLRQAQKMEAVGQLTGGVAHDFNNLLTAITGGLGMVRMRIAQGRPEEAGRYIAAAEDGANRAAALTQRLLAFSRRQTLEPKTIQANNLVADLLDLIRHTVGPHITVGSQLAEDLWPTRCDANQLENALLNLAINARDAMPDGGNLTLTTENRTIDERAAQERDMAPGEYVAIAVIDTGTGMAPEVIARAFDPFFTTKPLGRGTGLGLSMIYGFTKQSGGQARIHSALGEGTTVRLYLPRDTAAAQPEISTGATTASPSARNGETILVVDDEPLVAMLMTDLLEAQGYVPIEAPDGASGLNILRSERRIDLLITDVGLPGGMNGRQFADAARLVHPDLKILFVTGYAEHGVLADIKPGRGTRIISKPFAIDSFATTIHAMLGGEEGQGSALDPLGP
jgi:PAS domain S-box-containing protein